MQLTFIVTIDPVKGLPLLNVLIHSLNLQTRKNFNVVFYNQTRFDEDEWLERIEVRPRFDYRFFSIDRSLFLGGFPLWDLYTFHRMLLDANLLGDYFMSMHMEEWLDVDYIEQVTRVLKATRFDILLGHLCRTDIDQALSAEILKTCDSSDLSHYVRRHGIRRAPHWAFQRLPASVIGKLSVVKQNCQTLIDFNFRRSLTPTPNGYSSLTRHYEDLYFMSRTFACRYDWFLTGRQMFFEDIQLCDIPGVCELGAELRGLTEFPRYFNRSRIYHLPHSKFYYQLEDKEFGDALLELKTDDRLLLTLQEAVRMFRTGRVSLHAALRHTRANAEGTGSQNLNYRYHMAALEQARHVSP